MGTGMAQAIFFGNFLHGHHYLANCLKRHNEIEREILWKHTARTFRIEYGFDADIESEEPLYLEPGVDAKELRPWLGAVL